MLNTIQQYANTPPDNLHRGAQCGLNDKVLNWHRNQLFISTFYSKCLLTLVITDYMKAKMLSQNGN